MKRYRIITIENPPRPKNTIIGIDKTIVKILKIL
jgi:hypothetical protein